MKILSERDVAQAGDGVVTVRKSVLDLGRENIVGIKLSIESAADDPLTVRVDEHFPGHVSMSDIQAHPNYHPEKWTIAEGRHLMSFDADLGAGGSIETVYGVRVVDSDLDPFVSEPSVSYDLEGGSTDEPTAEAGGQAVTDAAGDGSQPEDRPAAPSSADAAEPAAVDPPSEATGGDDTPALGSVGPPRPDDAGDAGARSATRSFEYGEDRHRLGTEPSTETDQTAAGPSVDAMIEAIARTELTADQRSAVRSALDLGPSESQRMQLAQLQSSVARLSTYAEEFEAFVDAVGAPADAVAELRSGHERLATSVDDLADAADAAADQRDALRSLVDELEEALESLGESLSREIRSTEDRLRDDLTAEVAAGDDRVREALTGEMDRRDGRLREAFDAELGALEDRLRADLADQLDTMDDRVGELESVLATEEFEGIREVIAAERAWRDRLETARNRRQAPSASRGTER